MAGNSFNLLGDYTYADGHVYDLKSASTNHKWVQFDTVSATSEGDPTPPTEDEFPADMFLPAADARIYEESDLFDMFPHGPPIPIGQFVNKTEHPAPSSLAKADLKPEHRPLHAPGITDTTITVAPDFIIPNAPQNEPSQSVGSASRTGNLGLSRNARFVGKNSPPPSRPTLKERLVNRPSLTILQSKQKRKPNELASSDFDDGASFNTPSTVRRNGPPYVPLAKPSTMSKPASRAEDAIREMRAGQYSTASVDKFTTRSHRPQYTPPLPSAADFVDTIDDYFLDNRSPPKKKTRRNAASSLPSPNDAAAFDVGLPATHSLPTIVPAATSAIPTPSQSATLPQSASPFHIRSQSKTKTATPYTKKTTRNGHSRNSGYVPEFDDTFAPHETARLPACKMSATEILCFFPRHTQWPDIMLRLLGNDWVSSTMADAILFFRGRLDLEHHTRRNAAQRRQIGNAGKDKFQNPAWTVTNATATELHPVANYDVSSATPPIRQRVTQLESLKLVDVARGVQRWPAGEDQGIVSQVLYFAYHNPAICANLNHR